MNKTKHLVSKKPFKNVLNCYNVKIIETPTSLEIWEYLDNPVSFLEERNYLKIFEESDEKNLKKNNEKSDALKHCDLLKRKQKYYESMRWEIARIIDCNFDDKTKFVTLTFKENVKDVLYTNYEFSKFIKRLNFNLYKVKKQKLKYLAVWEKQKRGAIHYHVIFFDLPYIKNKDLQEIWGHGYIKINKIDVDSIDNRGRYISKYFSKDLDYKDYKQKSFFKSQNLLLPKVEYLKKDDFCLDFSGLDVVFTKVYTRQCPQFDNLSIENYLTFVDSEVRYTKIRKGF